MDYFLTVTGSLVNLKMKLSIPFHIKLRHLMTKEDDMREVKEYGK